MSEDRLFGPPWSTESKGPESVTESLKDAGRCYPPPPRRLIGHREWMRLVHLGVSFPEVSLDLREWVASVSDDPEDAERIMRQMCSDLLTPPGG